MTGPELQVEGGAGGTEARYEDIGILARHSGDLAAALAGISAECHAALADPDVLASAVLDPAGVARFEGALLAALEGRDGLTAVCASLGEQFLALHATVTGYQTVDEAQAQAIDGLRWLAGAATPTALFLAGSAALVMLPQLGVGLAAYQLAGGEVDWERLITDHPGIVDNVVGASPGLVSALPGMPLVDDVPEAARLLGQFYPDGTARVTGGDVDTGEPIHDQTAERVRRPDRRDWTTATTTSAVMIRTRSTSGSSPTRTAAGPTWWTFPAPRSGTCPANTTPP